MYAYLRKSDNTPYYIGKGKEYRAWDRKHSVSVPKDMSKIVLIQENLSDTDACLLEREMIQKWGRKDLGTGILLNRTDGGEGPSGIKQTKKHRRNISIALTGKPKSETHKENQRQSMLGKNKGIKKGPQSKDHKSKLSSVRKNKRWYNNGKENKAFTIGDEIPEGFVSGMLSKSLPKIVCRLVDKREMDIRNFKKWMKNN